MCIFQGTISLSFAIVYPIIEKFDRTNTYQYELRDSKLYELKKLEALLFGDLRDAFNNAYGNFLGVLLTKDDAGLILTFANSMILLCTASRFWISLWLPC